MPLPPYNESVWEHGRTSRLLDRFFSGYPFPARRDFRIYEPKLKVKETEQELILTCEIPDLKKADDLEVELRDHVLYIDGRNVIKVNNPALPYMVKRYKASFALPLLLYVKASNRHIGKKREFCKLLFLNLPVKEILK